MTKRILFLYLLTIFGLMAFVVTVYGMAKLPIFSDLGPTGKFYAMDFLNFWAAPQLATRDVSQLFSLDAYNAGFASLGLHLNYRYVWSYPPHALAMLAPLALFSFRAAYIIWSILGVALYAFILSRRLPTPQRWLAIFFAACAPVSLPNLYNGQNGFFTAALTIGAIMLLETRPKIAGILLGILSIKPQMLLTWPIILLREQRWQVILIATVTTLALVAISMAIYGVDVWLGFLHFTVPIQTELANVAPQARGYQLSMVTLPIALQRLGISHDIAFLCQWLMALGVAIILAITISKPMELARRAILITSAGLLLSPYVLAYDMAALNIAILWYFFTESKPRGLTFTLYSLGYLIPACIGFMYYYAPVAPFMIMGIFGITVFEIHRANKTSIIVN